VCVCVCVCVCDADTKETVKLGDCQILEARNGVGTGSSGCTAFLLFLESEQVGLLADTCGQGSGEEEHEETHCLKQCSSFGQFSGFSCAFTRHFGGFEAGAGFPAIMLAFAVASVGATVTT
jgi:hypothetical protein